MAYPTLLALIAAAQVASTDVSPDLAANASAFTPVLGLGAIVLAGNVGQPAASFIGPLGLGLAVLGPGAGAFVAGDPGRGAAIAAGGLAIPATTALGLWTYGVLTMPATCDPLCGRDFPLPTVIALAVGLAVELGYYAWAVGDARTTATRKNEERRSQQGAALGN